MLSRAPFSPYLGALNAPSVPLPPDEVILASHHILSDFDIYTMQRDRRYWKKFLVWKAAKVLEAETWPLRVGDILSAEKHSFIQHFALLRSPLPIPPIPPETVARVGGCLRSKDVVAETVTNGLSGTFTFKITGIIRASKDTYSQVLSGVVQIHPTLPDDADPLARRRLLAWNVAEDIARREEAAYDRLKAFQGSLLPYSYGFHYMRFPRRHACGNAQIDYRQPVFQCTFPDGHRCLGFIMEYIEGTSLDKAHMNELPEDVQKEFALSIRHGLRVLRYAQVEQTDWHVDQFIVQPSTSNQLIPKFVFIDFGFALQHLDALFTPPTLDRFYCRNRLWEVMEEALVDSVWFPLDENEY
ncbi:hypothetical protein K439DRAFT_1620378 [Ramaria rubella]|nr:hypothetical protein K439DRAFT_1620378 [Ramaria rubella]